MSYVLQIDFKMDGPFGEEMSKAFTDLANSINDEPGFIWKIWTENKAEQEAGGIYLFETKQAAENYLTMHMERLSSFGITDARGKIFEVNEPLTNITHGPVE